MATTTMSQLATAYITLRDQRAEVNREAKEKAAEIDKKMAAISAAMIKMLDTVGANSMSVDGCTVYKQESVLPRATDWEAFYKWIGENDAYDFLEKRITAKAVVAYLEEYKDLPPGVGVSREVVARVVRK